MRSVKLAVPLLPLFLLYPATSQASEEIQASTFGRGLVAKDLSAQRMPAH